MLSAPEGWDRALTWTMGPMTLQGSRATITTFEEGPPLCGISNTARDELCGESWRGWVSGMGWIVVAVVSAWDCRSILRNVASTFQRYSNDLMSPRKEPFTIEPKVHWELCFIQSESSKPDYLHVCIKANDHYLQVESKREASQNNVRTEFHPRSAHAWSLITDKDTLHSEPIGSFMKVHMSLRCPQSRHQRSTRHVFLSQEVWNAWGADSLRLQS